MFLDFPLDFSFGSDSIKGTEPTTQQSTDMKQDVKCKDWRLYRANAVCIMIGILFLKKDKHPEFQELV